MENDTSENEIQKNTLESFEMELDYMDPDLQDDKLWRARTGLNEDTLCGAIETIVFMSDRPISLQKIKNTIDPDMSLRVLYDSIKRLQEDYETSHHGIRLVEIAEGFQFRTKPSYSKYVQDLFRVNSLVLSPTALEVLAILAYKQPVSRIEVERIRGVDSSHIVRLLMDKRLVKVVGRSEEMGRPVLYGTTPEFLEVFNLKDLSELPPENELEGLAEKNEIGKITDIKTLISDKAKNFYFDEIDELDELAAQIKNIASDTSFTKTLKGEDKKRSQENTVIKSAFDLLEEFVGLSNIENQNFEASNSELVTSIADAQVVDPTITDKLLNAPEIDEEFEANLEEQLRELEEEDGDLYEEKSMEAEKQALSEALDEAFDRIGLSELSEDEFQEDIQRAEIELEEKSQEIANLGAEHGFDLDFLSNENNTDKTTH